MGGFGGSQEGDIFCGVRSSELVAIKELMGSTSRRGMRRVDGRYFVH